MTLSGESYSESWKFTITFSENDDGWFTAQIVEFPAAISQGATTHQARSNVLTALGEIWKVGDR